MPKSLRRSRVDNRPPLEDVAAEDYERTFGAIAAAREKAAEAERPEPKRADTRSQARPETKRAEENEAPDESIVEGGE